VSLSVIIPAWNASGLLAQAIESVRRQAIVPDEIIVVDDGSQDATVEIATSLGADIRVIHHRTNRGPAAARNSGLTAARGDWIAFLDADDLWPPDKLALQGEALRADPDCGVCLGLQRQFRHPNLFADGTPEVFSEVAYFIFLFGCGIFRRDVVDRIGPIDESMRHGEDSDWFFRLWEQAHRMLLLPEVTVHYRRHPGGITYNKTLHEMGHLKAMAKSVARRRKAGTVHLPEVMVHVSSDQCITWLETARRDAGSGGWRWHEWLSRGHEKLESSLYRAGPKKR